MHNFVSNLCSEKEILLKSRQRIRSSTEKQSIKCTQRSRNFRAIGIVSGGYRYINTHDDIFQNASGSLVPLASKTHNNRKRSKKKALPVKL